MLNASSRQKASTHYLGVLSLTIHARTWIGQFSSVVPPASQRARNLTACRSTRLTSFRFSTFRCAASESTILCNSVMFLTPTRPLTAKTTRAPRTDRSILSILVLPDAGPTGIRGSAHLGRLCTQSRRQSQLRENAGEGRAVRHDSSEICEVS